MRRLPALLVCTLLSAAPAPAREIAVGAADLRPAGPLGFLVPRLDPPPIDPLQAEIDPAATHPAAGL